MSKNGVFSDPNTGKYRAEKFQSNILRVSVRDCHEILFLILIYLNSHDLKYCKSSQ